MKRLAIAVVVFAGIGYAAACAYLWARQREIIFEPTPTVLNTPTGIGGPPYQPLSIPVGAAGLIAAWWLPSSFAQSAPAALLYLHGNDQNLGREVARLSALRRFGLPILAIDYRGYGQSSGPAPAESRVYEDAAAARDYMIHSMGLSARQIIVWGHSLGGAIAAELAQHQPRVCAIVLESTFTSMADMGRLRYPMFPVDWLLNQRFETIQRIARLQMPVLLVHGTQDNFIPASMSEQLLTAAREPKRLLLVDGAGHEDALQDGGRLLREAVEKLVQQCGRSG